MCSVDPVAGFWWQFDPCVVACAYAEAFSRLTDPKRTMRVSARPFLAAPPAYPLFRMTITSTHAPPSSRGASFISTRSSPLDLSAFCFAPKPITFFTEVVFNLGRWNAGSFETLRLPMIRFPTLTVPTRLEDPKAGAFPRRLLLRCKTTSDTVTRSTREWCCILGLFSSLISSRLSGKKYRSSTLRHILPFPLYPSSPHRVLRSSSTVFHCLTPLPPTHPPSSSLQCTVSDTGDGCWIHLVVISDSGIVLL